MKVENISSMPSSTAHVQQIDNIVEAVKGILKTKLLDHPILQRLNLKLNNKFDANLMTTKYTRMPHRHSRS